MSISISFAIGWHRAELVPLASSFCDKHEDRMFKLPLDHAQLSKRLHPAGAATRLADSTRAPTGAARPYHNACVLPFCSLVSRGLSWHFLFNSHSGLLRSQISKMNSGSISIVDIK